MVLELNGHQGAGRLLQRTLFHKNCNKQKQVGWRGSILRARVSWPENSVTASHTIVKAVPNLASNEWLSNIPRIQCSEHLISVVKHWHLLKGLLHVRHSIKRQLPQRRRLSVGECTLPRCLLLSLPSHS